MAKKKPEALTLKGMLSQLVEQFSQPLAFYRELIQNSIDAGSHRIDVTLEYKEAEKMVSIAVEDYGEGMNEEIIDNYLLVLFASTKEKDLTKIGKFGVGFVSIFAVQPELVVVETAREGEAWRILFKEDMTYEKIRLPRPTREGTRVELLKQMPKLSLRDFVEQSYNTILFWCKHSECEIYFEDRSAGTGLRKVNQPFHAAPFTSLCSVYWKEEPNEFLAAFTAQDQLFCGFYNRGITLKEGNKNYIPKISFKIKSPLLKHTITRDNVSEDSNFAQAMSHLRAGIEQFLFQKLAVQLEAESLKPPERDALTTDLFEKLLDFAFTVNLAANLTKARIFPGWTRSYCLKDLKKGFYFSKKPSHLTDWLSSRGVPVLRGSLSVLNYLSNRCELNGKRIDAVLLFPQILLKKDLEVKEYEWLSMVNHAQKEVLGWFNRVELGNFETESNSPWFIVSENISKPVNLPPPTYFAKAWFFKPSLVLNKEHPYVLKLLNLAKADARLSSFLLMKAIILALGDTSPDLKASQNLTEKLHRKLLHRFEVRSA